MKDPIVSKAEQAEIEKATTARADLNKLLDKKAQEHMSLAELAEAAATQPDLESPTRNAIFKWLDESYDIDRMLPATRRKLIRLAALMEQRRAAPLSITIGLVAHAAEAILALLLGAPDTWQAEIAELKKQKPSPEQKRRLATLARLENAINDVPTEGSAVRVVPMSSVPELITALKDEGNPIDCIVAPRHLYLPKDGPIQRLFRVSKTAACGLVQIPGDSEDGPEPSSAEIYAHLSEMARSTKTIGVLANGGFNHALRDFLRLKTLPLTTSVTSSTDAFNMLKDGHIRAVIGHRTMCENTKVLVKQARASLVADNKDIPKALCHLRMVPPGIFPCTRMDIWVNADKLKKRPGVACKIFHLFFTVMETYIEGKNGAKPKKLTGQFNALVNWLLELDEVRARLENDDAPDMIIKELKDAKHIFGDYLASDDLPGDYLVGGQYLFRIGTFETKTLARFWV